MCLEQVYALNSIAGETIEIKAMQIPVFKNRSSYQTDAAKNMHTQIEEHFFAYDYIKKLLDSLSIHNSAIRRDELITYLRLVHAYAIQSITSVYQHHGLLNDKNDGKKFDDLENFTRTNDPLIEILNRAEKEFSGVGELASIFFSIAGEVSTELNLLMAFNNTSLSINLNKFFLIYQFPESYVSRIEEIVYPNWYTACFMSSCDNSSAWGHYGEQHKGLCLKFKSESVGDKLQLKAPQSLLLNANSI